MTAERSREQNAPTRGNSPLQRYSPLVVAALAFGFQLPFFDRWFSVMDEGHMLQFADLIAHGGMLYRDATSYPLPGAFYLLALAFRCFEPSVLVSRWLVLVEFTLFAPLVFAIVRRLVSPGYAWASVAVLLLYRAWAFPHWQMYNYSTTAMLLLTASLFALVRFLDGDDRRWLAGAGLLFGLGVFCKQDYGAAVFLATIATLVVYATTDPSRDRRRVAPLLITFLLPGALVGAAAGIHFWLQGQLAFVVQLTVLNHFVGLASYEYQEFPALLPLFEQDPMLRTGVGLYNNFPALLSTARGIAVFESPIVTQTAIYDTAIKSLIYGPILLVFFGAIRLFRSRAAFGDPAARPRALVETALFAFAAAFALLIHLYKPQDYVHLAVLYWPFLCLGVVYTHALLAERGRAGRIGGGALLAALLAAAVFTGQLLYSLRTAHSEPVPGPRAGIFAKPREAKLLGELVDYVRANSDPDETVAAIPYFPIVLFLADRDAPHAASYIVWPFPEYPDRDARIIAAMEASGTPLVLYNFSQFPNFPPVPEYAPDLYGHLVDAFRVDRVFNDAAFGYKLAGLRRESRTAAGHGLIEVATANGSLRVIGKGGRNRAVPPGERTRFVWAGDWPFRPTLAIRPTAGGTTALSFPVSVPAAGARLETSIGIHPGAWFRYPPSWSRFGIAVVADGERRELYSRKLDPHQVLSDRGWFDVTIPLDAWSGRKVTLEFSTSTALPLGEILQMGGFGDPRIIARSTGAGP